MIGSRRYNLFHRARRRGVASLLDTLTALGPVEATDESTYAG